MEWEHLEPPINKNVHVCKLSSAVDKERKTRNEHKKLQIIVDSLKQENIRLRRIIKKLKFRLNIKYVSRKKSSKKNKKKVLQNLIDE